MDPDTVAKEILASHDGDKVNIDSGYYIPVTLSNVITAMYWQKLDEIAVFKL